MTERTPPFEYAPIHERDFDLPDDANVALWVVVNVEYDHYDKAVTTPLTTRTTKHHPDVFNYGWRDYGQRVGFWRLRDILERHGIRPTVALNGDVCEYQPHIVEAGGELDWEFMGHGLTNTVRLAGMDEDEEREVIRATKDLIAEHAGKPPAGWLGPGLTETYNTVDILGDEGFQYVADWCNDEQPYAMDTEGDDLLALPYSLEMNDVPLFLNYNCSPAEYESLLKEQFDVLYREGNRAGNAKVMTIPIHTYLTGHPARSNRFDSVLKYITDHEDVWVATGRELADYYTQTYD